MGFRKIKLVLIISCLILFFQNCTSQKSEDTTQTSPSTLFTVEAGDTGYEGKPTVYAVATDDGNLCRDGKDTYSQIEINPSNDTAMKTRNMCQDIAPIALDFNDLELMPHNLENFPDSTDVYEKYDNGFAPGRLFSYCRGVADDNGIGTIVVDIVTRSLGDNKYNSRVVSGRYDRAGNLIETRDSGVVSTYRWSSDGNPGFAFFTYRDANGTRQWTYHVKNGRDTKGSLTYHTNTSQEWKNIWSFPCTRFME